MMDYLSIDIQKDIQKDMNLIIGQVLSMLKNIRSCPGLTLTPKGFKATGHLTITSTLKEELLNPQVPLIRTTFPPEYIVLSLL